MCVCVCVCVCLSVCLSVGLSVCACVDSNRVYCGFCCQCMRVLAATMLIAGAVTKLSAGCTVSVSVLVTTMLSM